jgi:hypothetical protein
MPFEMLVASVLDCQTQIDDGIHDFFGQMEKNFLLRLND